MTHSISNMLFGPCEFLVASLYLKESLFMHLLLCDLWNLSLQQQQMCHLPNFLYPAQLSPQPRFLRRHLVS